MKAGINYPLFFAHKTCQKSVDKKTWRDIIMTRKLVKLVGGRNMNKEEILNKSRQEKFDEGMLHSEEKGRKIGIKVFCGVFIFIVLFNMFFSHGNNTTFYAVSSMFWAFAAGEAFPKYQFTHNKAFMVTTVVGGIASAAYLASFVLSVLG